MTTLVLATRNRGKLRELQAMVAGDPRLQGLRVQAVTDYPDVADVVETGVTFAENAALKATAVADATGRAALADDSGLAVDVLGGCPGVFSARWSGTHGADRENLELLLAQTADVPVERLTARFVCCVVLALPGGGTQVTRTGEVAGRLTRHPRGRRGFGYDPIFELPDGRTMAELGESEKNAISHRGRALRALLPELVTLLGPAQQHGGSIHDGE